MSRGTMNRTKRENNRERERSRSRERAPIPQQSRGRGRPRNNQEEELSEEQGTEDLLNPPDEDPNTTKVKLKETLVSTEPLLDDVDMEELKISYKDMLAAVQVQATEEEKEWGEWTHVTSRARRPGRRNTEKAQTTTLTGPTLQVGGKFAALVGNVEGTHTEREDKGDHHEDTTPTHCNLRGLVKPTSLRQTQLAHKPTTSSPHPLLSSQPPPDGTAAVAGASRAEDRLIVVDTPMDDADSFLKEILTWNCQRAGKQRFKNACKELCQEHRPDIVVVVEPRISGRKAARKIRTLGYSNSHRVDARGFSGGIWVLWQDDRLEVEVEATHTQFIHLKVRKEDTVIYVTAVYGAPQKRWRQFLWRNIEALAQRVASPWFLIGDFNAILDGLERQDSRGRNGAANKAISDCVFHAKLHDIGFEGAKFTWKSGEKYARLDRVLSNAEGLVKYPLASVKHLPRIYSNHNPILLSLKGGQPNQIPAKPFKFLAAWLMHEGFEDFMQNEWDGSRELPKALKLFVDKDTGKISILLPFSTRGGFENGIGQCFDARRSTMGPKVAM
ncbi:hypothetical protein Tsubulata_047576 [Turnera subulata]|uniref:Endonuclease/exonuclease/phosphatase domain-containing protein n=1 Tax=Turnera subulata TaxID=218843 RepID=A0A9Q0FGZ4_9ROSI|nr:hypothetical protein Tsubulata_047576 [Turnera subulata]